MRKPELCEAAARLSKPPENAPKRSRPQKAPKRKPSPPQTAHTPKRKSSPPQTVVPTDPGPFLWSRLGLTHVSGPVSVTVFNAPRGKQIYIFGDRHDSRHGMCSAALSEKYMTFTNFIKRTVSQRKGSLQLDLFVEMSRYFEYDVNLDFNDDKDTPLDVVRYVFPRLKKDNFLCHKSDARKEKASRAFFHVYSINDNWESQKYGANRKYMRQFVERMSDFETFKHLSQDILFEEDLSSWYTRWNIPHDGSKNKIAKQFHKLTKAQQKVVRDYAMENYSFLPFWKSKGIHAKIVKCFRSVLESPKQDPKFIRDVNALLLDVVLSMTMTHMDVYLLCRMLHRMDLQDDQGVCVVYAGDSHARNYVHALEGLFGKPVYHHTTTDGAEDERCVSLTSNQPFTYHQRATIVNRFFERWECYGSQ
jgi:hypothetical protein